MNMFILLQIILFILELNLLTFTTMTSIVKNILMNIISITCSDRINIFSRIIRQVTATVEIDPLMVACCHLQRLLKKPFPQEESLQYVMNLLQGTTKNIS